jgi:hypothetical protein
MDEIQLSYRPGGLTSGNRIYISCSKADTHLGQADLVSAVLAGRLPVLPVHVAVAEHRDTSLLYRNKHYDQ